MYVVNVVNIQLPKDNQKFKLVEIIKRERQKEQG